MVWPTRMNTEEDAERPLPSRASASPPRFASLSTKTGRPMRAVQALGDVDALPAAEQARGGDHAGARVDGGRQREPDGEQVADRAAERLHHVAQQDAEPVELRVVAVIERERQGWSG